MMSADAVLFAWTGSIILLGELWLQWMIGKIYSEFRTKYLGKK